MFLGDTAKGGARKARVLSCDAGLPWKLYNIANKAWLGDGRAHKFAERQKNSKLYFFR